ncbi:MAG: hypothetical protein AB7S92_25315 [Parvibaculaceae bacterium]
MTDRRSEWRQTGTIVSIVAAVVSLGAAIWTVNIQKQGAAELARIKAIGGLDRKGTEFAMILLRKPNASLAERRWALDVLSAAEKVPMSPTRKRQITRSGQALSEIGKSIPEAKALNDKLEAIPFWLDLTMDDVMDGLPLVGSPESGMLDLNIDDLQSLGGP